jgi:RNA polymerase sigma-70 factor, ECF subfamily
MDQKQAAKLLDELFETWYASLIRYAFRNTGRFELAEDVVQETFFQLYLALKKGTEIQNPRAWTLTVVRREISNYCHQNPSHERLETAEYVAAGDLDGADRRLEFDCVSKLFNVLSRREEEVLLLRLQALKYREIAQALGISSGCVPSLLARALRKLQTAASRDANQNSVIEETQIVKTLR